VPKVRNFHLHKFLEAGISHIVTLSTLGAWEADPKKFLWAYQHRQVEDYIRNLGLILTSLRPSSLFTNLFGDASSIKTQNAIFRNLGAARLNWISPYDVGEAAAVVLTSPTRDHANQCYTITGPDTLNSHQLCEAFSQELGREIKCVEISDEELRHQASTFLPEEAIDGFLNSYFVLQKWWIRCTIYRFTKIDKFAWSTPPTVDSIFN